MGCRRGARAAVAVAGETRQSSPHAPPSCRPHCTLFLSRWSGRAFTGEPLPDGALASLLEAARWAPSSGNNQPWRLVYVLTGTAAFATFHDLLAPGNKPWCEKASALFVVASRATRDDGRPARTHAFDTGAARSAPARSRGSRHGGVRLRASRAGKSACPRTTPSTAWWL